MEIGREFLNSALLRFQNHKEMGHKALEQVSDADLEWRPDEESNSIRVIVQHLHGNMLSRWTDFLTTDGEKPTRQRDAEFELRGTMTRAQVLAAWEEGWQCLLAAVRALDSGDLLKTVHIRKQPLLVVDAVNRQLTHVAYHVGQIVWIAKARKGTEFRSLSIPRGMSNDWEAITKHHRDYAGEGKER